MCENTLEPILKLKSIATQNKSYEIAVFVKSATSNIGYTIGFISPGFFYLSTIDLGLDTCERLSCWVFGSTPGLCSLDASSTPQVVATEYIFRHCQMFSGKKNCPWLKPTVLIG